MKALTLWQPWASLVALGVKTIETRSWSTSYRGPLAIHAAARRPTAAEHQVGDTVVGYHDRLDEFFLDDGPGDEMHELPLGVVVATCTLVDVVPTESLYWTRLWPRWAWQLRSGSPLYPPQSPADIHGLALVAPLDQRPYGDFTPGRYAWLLDGITPLDEPVPARGRQQLWEWTP